MGQIPEPAALPQVDDEQGTLNLVVLVAGAGARSWVDAVGSLETGVHPGVAVSEDAVNYLPVRLGQLKQWTVWIHLYGLSGATTESELMRYTPRADGVVVSESAAEEPTESAVGVAVHLARMTEAPPVAVCGSDDLTRRWSTLTDREPVYSRPGTAADVLPTLKALAAKMLARVRH